MATSVKDANGNIVSIENPAAVGRAAAAASKPVVLSTEDAAKVPALGQAAMAASTPVVLASNQTAVPVVSNNSVVKLSATFNRPADTTAYAAGDLVTNSTIAGSVVALTFTGAVRSAGDAVRIERARITKTAMTNASFRLHLFEAVPVPSVGDNAAFNASNVLSTTGGLTYVGSIPVNIDVAGSDGSSGRGVPSAGSGMTLSPTSGTSIYGLLEATGAYTPASAETFVVILEAFRP